MALLAPAGAHAGSGTTFTAPWPTAEKNTTQRDDGTALSHGESTAAANETRGVYAVSAAAQSGLPVPLEVIEGEAPVNGTATITFSLPYETATGNVSGVIVVRRRGTSEANSTLGDTGAAAAMTLSCGPDCLLSSQDPGFAGGTVLATSSAVSRPVLDGAAQQIDWKTVTASFSVARTECAPGAVALTIQVVASADASMLSHATVEAEYVLESVSLEDLPCPPST